MKRKINRLNALGFSVVELLIAIIVVGVIGSIGAYVLTRSNAQTPNSSTGTSNVTLTTTTRDIYLGDVFTMQILNLPNNLKSKPLIVLGSCVNNGKTVGSISSALNGVNTSSGVVQMTSAGGAVSEMALNDLPSTCKVDLRYSSNSGIKVIASTNVVLQSFRASMKVNQTTPVSITAPVSFSLTNLPTDIPHSSIKVAFYCDIPNNTGSTSTTTFNAYPAAYDTNDQSALVSIVNSASVWPRTGATTNCYAFAVQFDLSLPDGTTYKNIASTKFQVTLN